MDNQIEISPYGNLLVYKHGYSAGFVRSVIEERKLEGLRVFSILKDQKVENTDFLKKYTFLKSLDITSSCDYDFSFLSYLKGLHNLTINTADSKDTIDLSSLENLETLSINWRKGKISGLEKCTKLTSLVISEYKEENFSPIKSVNLISLKIKTSTIKSDQGIENLPKLKHLELGNCRKLKSLNSIKQLKNLETLLLNSCSNIADYHPLEALSSLKELNITDCKNINTIGFISNLPNLSKLSLLGNSIVIDGNMTPAQNIKELFYRHYDHYNLKIETKKHDDLVKSNLKKIKNLFK